MPCDIKAYLKTAQVIVCGVGLIYMVLTTWEANRVNKQLQKQSKEGKWASFTVPTSLASMFIYLSFGTYFITSFCLLFGHLYGDVKTVGETMLMVVGCLMMIAVGGILVVSIDDVPDKLFDNTVVLGVLALIAGVLLLTDAGTKCAKLPMPKRKVTTNSKKKREIEIIPKEQQPKTEVQTIDEKIEEPKQEAAPKKEAEDKPVKENAISSVEIRIKDPNKNWPVYGERTRATSEIDVLAEAEAVDKMLTSGVALGRARGQLPRLSESPLRHTSSFYINQTPQFAWKRLNGR